MPKFQLNEGLQQDTTTNRWHFNHDADVAFKSILNVLNCKMQKFTWRFTAIEAYKPLKPEAKQILSQWLNGWVLSESNAGYLLQTSNMQIYSSVATAGTSTTRGAVSQNQSVWVGRYVTTVARKDEHVLNTVWWWGSRWVRAWSCIAEPRRLTAVNCNQQTTTRSMAKHSTNNNSISLSCASQL